jgi:type III secretion protein T
VSNVLGQLVAAGFFMLDGMMVLVGLILHSFHWWPLHSMGPSLTDGLERFVSAQMYSYLASVAKIAAPIMLVLVLIDLAIGLIGRTAEKLEPNNLTQPIKGAVATLMLALLVSAYFDEARPMIGMRSLEAQMRHWAQDLGLKP